MTKPLLLDTCALLWLGNAPERFSPQAMEAIESAPFLYASPISLWEVAHKCQLGKLQLSVSAEECPMKAFWNSRRRAARTSLPRLA